MHTMATRWVCGDTLPRIVLRQIVSQKNRRPYLCGCTRDKNRRRRNRLGAIKRSIKYISSLSPARESDVYTNDNGIRRDSIVVREHQTFTTTTAKPLLPVNPPSLRTLALVAVGNTLDQQRRENHEHIVRYIVRNLLHIPDIVCFDVLTLAKKSHRIRRQHPVNANECVIYSASTCSAPSCFRNLWKLCCRCKMCYATNNVYFTTQNTNNTTTTTTTTNDENFLYTIITQ